MPNAGKSTLLSKISNAKPKIADYPFTTLTPNLGVVQIDRFFELLFVDIPGLIEGAHEGRGLGDRFLKHIERTRIILHLIDVSEGDPIEKFHLINRELREYNPKLVDKPTVVALNKIDLITDPQDLDRIREVAESFKEQGYPTFIISAYTGEGIQPMLWKIKEMYEELGDEISEEAEKEKHADSEPTEVVLRLGNLDLEIEPLEGDKKIFRVRDRDFLRIVMKLDFYNIYAQKYFMNLARGLRILRSLKLKGLKEGDIVEAAGIEFEFKEGTLVPLVEPTGDYPYAPKYLRKKRRRRR